ncbi:MAG: hypothetical protein AB1705_01905 [Verrucomicrobiota bacterium]
MINEEFLTLPVESDKKGNFVRDNVPQPELSSANPMKRGKVLPALAMAFVLCAGAFRVAQAEDGSAEGLPGDLAAAWVEVNKAQA